MPFLTKGHSKEILTRRNKKEETGEAHTRYEEQGDISVFLSRNLPKDTS